MFNCVFEYVNMGVFSSQESFVRHIEYIGATLIEVASPKDPWCKAFAINRAIRTCLDNVEESETIIMTLDCDMVLHPEMVKQVLKAFKKDPKVLLHCPNLSITTKKALKPQSYDQLREKSRVVKWDSKLRKRIGPVTRGFGGCQAALASWWKKVRGLDEELLWWGMEDYDLHRRAKMDGLKIVWLPQDYAMLHQWHAPGQYLPGMQKQLARNMKICWTKLANRKVTRNPKSWGGRASGP